MVKKQEHRKWSKERWKVFFEKDLPIGITIACVFAFCVVMCVDDERPSTKTETMQPYSQYERGEDVSVTTTSRRRVSPAQSRENEMIDRLSREDFYEESDYYDGLDGEYNDVDYNEVVDYFAD